MIEKRRVQKISISHTAEVKLVYFGQVMNKEVDWCVTNVTSLFLFCSLFCILQHIDTWTAVDSEKLRGMRKKPSHTHKPARTFKKKAICEHDKHICGATITSHNNQTTRWANTCQTKDTFVETKPLGPPTHFVQAFYRVSGDPRYLI